MVEEPREPEETGGTPAQDEPEIAIPEWEEEPKEPVEPEETPGEPQEPPEEEEPEEALETPPGEEEEEPGKPEEEEEEFASLELPGISDEERESELYKRFQAHFTRVRQRDADERREYEALKRMVAEDPEIKARLREKLLGEEKPEEPKIEEPDPSKFLEDPQGYIRALVDARVKKEVSEVQKLVEEQRKQVELQKWEAEVNRLKNRYPDFSAYEAKVSEYLQAKPLVAQAVLSGQMKLEEVFRVVAPTAKRKAKRPTNKQKIRGQVPTRSVRRTAREPGSLEEAILESIEEINVQKE